jgi:hypothetical protein
MFFYHVFRFSKACENQNTISEPSGRSSNQTFYMFNVLSCPNEYLRLIGFVHQTKRTITYLRSNFPCAESPLNLR